jgi:nucleotide sugar dehydrogenase
LALLANAHGINFQEMLSLINGDNEANLLQPGIGVAGHCTPVYPYFLIENFRSIGLDFSLAAEGRRINDEMAAYAVSLVQPQLVHKKVLILGLAFRPGVKEDAGSVAYRLKPQLEQAGIASVLHDPHYSEQEIQQRGFTCSNDLYESGAEALILVTMHREYSSIDWKKMAASGIQYVVDGRNQLDREAIKAAGIHYWGIGRS